MNSDSVFTIGKTHAVCQDYAAAGVVEGSCYAVISDGCSSSPDTDIGARILVKTAARKLQMAAEMPTRGSQLMRFYDSIAGQSAEIGATLCLSPSALDATLLFVHAAGGRFVVGCYGDGVVTLGRADGTIEVSVVRYRSGYPAYPSYLLDPARRERHRELNAGGREVESWTLPCGPEHSGKIKTSERPLYVVSGECAEYTFAAVLSDGVHSFMETAVSETSRSAASVPVTCVLRELLAFKSYTGAFAQRRMQKYLRAGESAGQYHHDDVAMGVIAFGERTSDGK